MRGTKKARKTVAESRESWAVRHERNGGKDETDGTEIKVELGEKYTFS